MWFRLRPDDLRPPIHAPAHQRLDLGQAAGDAVDLGFEPDDAFGLGGGDFDLVLEFAGRAMPM
jgi:hypothetical protein